jgi:dynein heavy chain, axonemal
MEDRREMKKIITEQIELVLLTNMKECTNEKEEDTIFIDFFDENAPNVYQEVGYTERDKLKTIVEDKLKEYNEKAKRAQMHIVLFQDAIYYICKIHRIIKLSKGHGLLVGDGGSGRHCLTKLAAFIAEYHIFQVELHKAYKLREFREDIKRWSMQCGMKNQ